MIGKLIVHGKDREEAISKMKRALDEFAIDGITTNIDYHFLILDHEDFKMVLIILHFYLKSW